MTRWATLTLALPLIPPLIDAGIAVGGMITGGIVGQIISNIINADDAATFPDNPDSTPEKFKKLRKSWGNQCDTDGSIWEPDTQGMAANNGSAGLIKSPGKKVKHQRVFGQTGVFENKGVLHDGLKV